MLIRRDQVDVERWQHKPFDTTAFRALADEWRAETGFMSSLTDIVAHPAYQVICPKCGAVILMSGRIGRNGTLVPASGCYGWQIPYYEKTPKKATGGVIVRELQRVNCFTWKEQLDRRNSRCVSTKYLLLVGISLWAMRQIERSYRLNFVSFSPRATTVVRLSLGR